MLACLHPSASFVFGKLAFSEYEDKQIGVNFENWTISLLF
jgi:hypothetical protein